MRISKNKLIIALAAILIFSLWFNFFRHLRNPSFSAISQPLVTVNYTSKEGTLFGQKLEKARKLQLASQIFSYQFPQVVDADFITNSGLENYSDYSMVIAADREQFFATTPVVDIGDDFNNYISRILADEGNKKFLSLDSDQIYSAYFQLDEPSDSILINNVSYPISKFGSNYYKLAVFDSSGILAVGLKIPDGNNTISDAIFITAGNTERAKISRVVDEQVLIQSGSKLDVRLAKNQFMITKSSGDVRFRNNNLDQDPPTLVITNIYHLEIGRTFPSVDVTQSDMFEIFISSGSFRLNDLVNQQNLIRVITSTLIIAILALIPLFFSEIKKIIFALYHQLKKGKKFTDDYIGRKKSELILGIIFLNLLLVISTEPAYSQLLSTTNLLIIILLLLIMIFRFSIVASMIIFLVLFFSSGFMELTGSVSVAEKIGMLAILLLIEVAFNLALSNGKRKKS